MKKLCKNCIHFKVESVIVGIREERCSYILQAPYEVINHIERHPIPSIHNANNECPYYEESFLTKALRRFKK
jgi:uncharacterized CHY-type Zn-finger protein